MLDHSVSDKLLCIHRVAKSKFGKFVGFSCNLFPHEITRQQPRSFSSHNNIKTSDHTMLQLLLIYFYFRSPNFCFANVV
jgi:hypothetical protein